MATSLRRHSRFHHRLDGRLNGPAMTKAVRRMLGAARVITLV
jgi:hypothetical protein